MHLESLELTNFRNYEKTTVQFSPHINLIYGFNAQGKTNFLEAAYLLCLGRSFRNGQNQELVRKNAEFYTVKGLLRQDNGIDKDVVVHYVRDSRKEISIDRKRLTSHAKIFGNFPVVVMAPDEFKITSGSPAERRRFLDILLSQVSFSYLSDLQEYSRVLKQRNKLLQQIREGQNIAESAIEPWTRKLINAGINILNYRHNFVVEFSKRLNELYSTFTTAKDRLQLRVESTIYNNEEIGKSVYQKALDERKRKERTLGTTLAGPHRDDLVFSINGLDLRKFGSRGEHKSVLISLKIAEFHYLYEKRNETPLLLLDDCYSELDDTREKGVVNSIKGLGQILMTSPKENSLSLEFDDLNMPVSKYVVDQGQIEHVQN